MFKAKGNWSINGVISREMNAVSGGRGGYDVWFSRDDASIEQIEAIDWEHPDIVQHGERECPLPKDCAFAVEKISYFHTYRTYMVRVKKIQGGKENA